MRTDSHPPDAPTRPRTLGLVLARGGSEGLPGKNLRSLHGVPLVGRAIETLRSAAVIDRVVLSTDDPEIARVGEAHGAEVIARLKKMLECGIIRRIGVLRPLFGLQTRATSPRPANVAQVQPG